MENKRCFIIAEAGVNHNGDIGLAYKLIDAAKEAGVDCIKFQTFKTEKVISKNTEMASYQKENLQNEDTQYEMVKKLELSHENFKDLKKYCQKVGIQFLSTPDEEESLDFLVNELQMDTIKVGSGELTNYPYLKKIALKNKEIIISTGMSNLSEIERALECIRKYNNKEIIALHCTTNYPCPMEEVNLLAMNTIKEAFKIKVGYSDHTLGIEVPIAAVALGAEVIEKHFTLDKNMEGPDHRASLDPTELKLMVKSIRNIEKALGDGVKKPNKSEELIKKVVRRRVIIARDLEKGHILTEEDLEYKRANNGIEVEFYENVLGKKLVYSKSKEDILEWRDIENAN